jgi:hypothetical protein
MVGRSKGGRGYVERFGEEIEIERAERNRLVEQIDAVIAKERALLDANERDRARKLVRTLKRVPRGRQPERQGVRDRRWFRNPTNRAAFIAKRKEDAWRKKNRVKNNRVYVDGKWLPIHAEAAKYAIDYCNSLSPQPLKTNIDQVVAQLLRGKTAPPLKRRRH